MINLMLSYHNKEKKRSHVRSKGLVSSNVGCYLTLAINPYRDLPQQGHASVLG